MIAFQTTDWQSLEPVRHGGEAGFALIKTVWLNKIRIREVEYSAGYKANHWCGKGHIVFCEQGSYELYLKDGTVHRFTTGMSYQALDNKANPHMAVSEKGCRLYVVDGDFLNANSK